VAQQRSRLTILAVLAVAGDRGIRREKLAALFWPESDEDRARNALRQALFALRRDLAMGELTLGTAELRLNREVLSADVTEFDTALDAGRYEDAAVLYQGDFLDGVHSSGSVELEHWISEQRARLSESYGRALEGAAGAAAERGDRQGAAEWWGRRAAHDPLSGRVARAYMDALAQAGERERALRHAEVHAALLRQELDVEVDPDVVAFVERLRRATGATDAPLLAERAFETPVALQAPPHAPDSAGVPGAGATADVGAAAAPSRHGGARGSWRRGTSVGVVLLLMAAVTIAWLLRPADPASARRVLVVPFDNRTGDSSLADLGLVVADWLSQTLQRTGFVEVVDPVSTLKASRGSDRPGDGEGMEAAVRLARGAGAGLVIWGDVRREGDSLAFHAAISDITSRTVLQSARVVYSPKTAPLQAGNTLTDAVAGALAAALDRRLASIVDVSSEPPRFDAYREFIRGLDAFQQDNERSIPYFETASRIDTAFAQPLIWLAFAHGNLGHPEAQDSIIGILYSRRTLIDPMSRHALDNLRAERMGDRAAEYEAARAAADISPGSPWSHNVGILLLGQLRPAEALRYFRQVDAEHGWAGSWFPYWKNLTASLHLLGRHADEYETASRAVALDPDEQSLVSLEVRASIARGDVRGALSRLDSLLVMPPTYNSPGTILYVAAQEMRVHGRGDLAESLTDRAVRWYGSTDAERYAGLGFRTIRELQAEYVRALYEAGRWERAREAFSGIAADADAPGMTGLSAAATRALLDVRTGTGQLAMRTLDAFDSLPDTDLDRNSRLTDMARVAAALGQTDRALRYLTAFLTCCTWENLPMDLHRDLEWWSLRDDARFRQFMNAGWINTGP